MLSTRFTELVGCRLPLQLAGMGFVSGVDLVTAVADAGGLGMLALPAHSPEQLSAAVEEVARRTTGAFGVNFIAPFLDPASLDAVAGRVRVVEFFYDDPDPALVARARDGGALVGWQVGSVEEAGAAVAAGCDFIVAQGVEAGGHVRGTTGLLPLLAEVLDAVDVPVVAAGGIATARGMAAALAAGASAVRMGTRFVAAAEADAHPLYVAALLGARPEDAVLTEAYEVTWPNAPHRVLRSAIERARALPDDLAGELSRGDERLPVPRFAPPPPSRDTTGAIEAMALYAGQSVGAVREVKPAGEIVREVCEGAERLLRAAAPRD